MRPCYKFTAKAGPKPAVLAIDDEIGFWGTHAKDFRASLDTVVGDDLVVEINSPGGDVLAGIGMYNMLRNWANSGKTVTTRVTGIAASIASVVALAGDKREMPKNSFGMMHQVSSMAFGTSDDLRDAADVTDKLNTALRNIYVDRMGVDESVAMEIMSKDTWLTADECLEIGFATALIDDVRATASFNTARAALPEHVAKVFSAKADAPVDAPVDSPVDAPVAPVEAPAEDEQDPALETPEAEAIVAKAKSMGLEAHGAFFAVASTSLQDATERMKAARDIQTLCALVGRPDDARTHIRAGAKVPDVRAALLKAMAEDDEHTNPVRKNQTQSDAPGASSGVNTSKLWNSHNKALVNKEGR